MHIAACESVNWRVPISVECSLKIVISWFVVALVTTPGLAQEPEQKVLELNRVAMEQYNQLDFNAAKLSLTEAAAAAEQGNLSGAPLARTYLNMAVVLIAGFQDTTEGFNFCVRALEADPTVALDPLTSTPEIQQVFNLAKSRVGGPPAEPPLEPAPEPDVGTFAGPGNIPHIPVPEQLVRTAVPVFIEVPDDAEIGSIFLHYRGAKMRDFRRVEMTRVPGGLGFEVPCADAMEPKLSYYIEAFAPDNSRIGFAGTPEEPVEVPIVSSRTQPAPALPGRTPPEQCPVEAMQSNNMDEYKCRTTMDCYEGERCDNGYCIPLDGQTANEKVDAPRFFLQVGGAFGGGYATSGMPADREPAMTDSGDGNYPYRAPGESGCPSDLRGATHCVRVTDPGFVPFGALRLAMGYYVHPRFALAAYMRYQFGAGKSDTTLPANFMFGGRLQVLLTPPAEKGFHVDLFAGISYGQLQLKPNQAGAFEEPYIKSGPAGSQFGFIFAYRFVRNFGIYLTPEAMLQFPTFLFAIEGSGGLELAF